MNIREIFKITINLVLIYAIGGVLLAWVYSQTGPIIFKNQQEDKAKALMGMMPIHLVANIAGVEGAADKIKAALPKGAVVTEAEGSLDIEVDLYKKDKKKLLKKLRKAGALGVSEYSDYDPGEPKGTWEPAHKHAEFFEVVDKDGNPAGYIIESYHKGYSGAPGIYVAMDNDLVIRKVEILSHKETPGLGDEIEAPVFKNQFRGKTLGQLEVDKTGKLPEQIQAITGATISSRAVTYAARDAVKHMMKYKAGELPAAEAAQGQNAKSKEEGENAGPQDKNPDI